MSKGKGDLVAIPREGEESEPTTFAITTAEKPKNLGGRPTSYTPELGDYICEQITSGRSLRSICREDSMPHIATIFNWHRTVDGFLEQYARAKEEQADTNAEDIQDLADRVVRGEVEPQAARVAIDAYKWTASKLKAKKYGDKLDVTSDGKAMPTPILGNLIMPLPETKTLDD